MSTDINVKPLTAIAVIAFFLLLLGARFWAYGESVSVTGFSYLHKHPSGDTVVLFQNVLYRFNEANELHSKTALSELGVPAGQITDFAWFSNGDLLLRRGQREEGLAFNLDRYQRKQNSTPANSTDPQASLVHCSNDSGLCQPFADPPLNLNDVFALEIDTETDRVFVADTSRHKIYLLSAEGRELDRIDTGLKFPNQISYVDGILYVANTNHHQISGYQVTGDRFSREAEVISVTPEDAVVARQTWPAAFLFVDEMLWVINATNRMNQGGIYLFDVANDYGYSQQVMLGEDADPITMIRHGDRILVSDFSHDRIYELDIDGGQTGEFFPQWLRDDVMQVRAERERYQQLTTALTGLFIASLAAGFGYALYRQFGSAGEHRNLHEPLRASLININDPDILWIEPDRKTRRALYTLPVIMAMLVSGMLLLRAYTGEAPGRIDMLAMASLTAIAVILFTALYASLKKRIGVLGESLILMDRKGRYSASSGNEIQYSDAAILIGEHFVMLGAQPRIFPTDQMMKHVYPLLQSAEYITPGKMQGLLMRRSKTVLYAIIAIFVALIGVLVYLLF